MQVTAAVASVDRSTMSDSVCPETVVVVYIVRESRMAHDMKSRIASFVYTFHIFSQKGSRENAPA